MEHCNDDFNTLWWTNIAMENHHFYWENPLFPWPFSIAMLVHRRVNNNEDLRWRNQDQEWRKSVPSRPCCAINTQCYHVLPLKKPTWKHKIIVLSNLKDQLSYHVEVSTRDSRENLEIAMDQQNLMDALKGPIHFILILWTCWKNIPGTNGSSPLTMYISESLGPSLKGIKINQTRQLQKHL